MYLIISYDIRDDTRRLKIYKALKDHGQRVQFSVFECRMTKIQWLLLRQRLKGLLNGEEDSIRIYRLCETCLPKVERIGGEPIPDEETVVV